MSTEPAAAVLVYREGSGGLEVLLFRRRRPAGRRPRDAGPGSSAARRGWSLPMAQAPADVAPGPAPKGWENVPLRDGRKPRLRVAAVRERLLAAAADELERLTGLTPPGPFAPLGGVKMRGHRIVLAWAVRDDGTRAPDVATLPGDVAYDRAAFLPLERARMLVEPQQRRFLDDLTATVGGAAG